MAVPSSVDGRVRVVVATTVLLSFISFWRAAAIVLSDLGSTAFYVGGREDLLRRVGGAWKIAHRKLILDQNVLTAKNISVFF